MIATECMINGSGANSVIAKLAAKEKKTARE